MNRKPNFEPKSASSVRAVAAFVAIILTYALQIAPGANASQTQVNPTTTSAVPKVVATPITELSKIARNRASSAPSVTTTVVPAQTVSAPIQIAEPFDMAGPRTVLAGHHVPLMDISQATGRLADSTPMTVTFMTAPHNKAQMDILARRVNDPRDSMYGQFLTPAQRIAEFSPSTDDVAKVSYFAQQSGLKVTNVSSDRMLVSASGSASQVENALGIHLNSYVSPDGETFHAPDAEPSVPAAISPILIGIDGLSDTVRPKPDLETIPLPANNPMGAKSSGAGANPQSIGVYGIASMPAGEIQNVYNTSFNLGGYEITGTDQQIGLLEFGGYDQTNIDYYAYYNSTFATPAVNLNYVPINQYLVDGFDGSTNADENEVELDIEMVEAIADGIASCDVYETSQDGNTLDLVDTAAEHGDLQLSMSYSMAEQQVNATWQQDYDVITEILALQGQDLFVASGDTGAYFNTASLTVNALASSPWVTGVGGTTLSLDVTPTDPNYLGYQSETTWDDNGFASGGGISVFNTIPDYQSDYLSLFPESLNSPASSTYRNVPDVCLDADPNSGYYTHVSGSDVISGGTSAAAPIWASFFALVNETRLISSVASPLGFGNYALYDFALGDDYNSDFHDITTSANNFYAAVPGYDDATGLGSFQGVNLTNDLINSPSRSEFATLSSNSTAVMDAITNFIMTLTVPVPVGSTCDYQLYGQNSSGTNFQLGSGTIPGATSVTFTIKTTDVTSTVTPTITVTAFGSTASTTFSLTPEPSIQLTVKTSTLVAGSTGTGTVMLNASAPTGGAKVLLSSGDPSVVSVPASVTVKAGATTATFKIKSYQVSAPTPVVLTATYNSQSATATVTVDENTD